MISLHNNILGHITNKLVIVQKDKSVDNAGQLTDGERLQLKKLQKIDQEVRTHESQHMNGNVIALGAPKYNYIVGPDGRSYAIGGEVTLTTGSTSNPDTAIQRARALREASLATGSPSTNDLAAAESAKAMEMEALLQKSSKNNEVNNPYKFNDSGLNYINKKNSFLDIYA